jgi:methylated-DNA-[protein]-cysteine S-methyltransferase
MPEVAHFVMDQLPTPIGTMHIVADDTGNLRVAFFTEDEEDVRRHMHKRYGKTDFTLDRAHNPHGVADALRKYFAGELNAIDEIRVKATGTAFQQEVWNALREIPCGTTTSYGKLAEHIGHPAAVRAVGLANGSNPIAVVVPCHRVIGFNGSLTGYGGGLNRKRWLLDHESGLLF